MKTLIAIVVSLFILYILMLGWNDVMYKQFPSMIIHNYWLFVICIIGMYYITKSIK